MGLIMTTTASITDTVVVSDNYGSRYKRRYKPHNYHE